LHSCGEPTIALGPADNHSSICALCRCNFSSANTSAEARPPLLRRFTDVEPDRLGISGSLDERIFRWVQRFTPLLAEAARPCRHRVDDRWWVDETYVKVSGRWRYVYRAIDQFVYVSTRRDSAAARCFFTRALATMRVVPVEVTTDKAAVYTHVLDELAPDAWHCTQAYASNRMEADHGQLKRRLRPMRGLKTDQSARIIIAGHAFIQNIRRGHYELGVDEPVTLQVVAAVDELALAI
jgi:transposase-like protein